MTDGLYLAHALAADGVVAERAGAGERVAEQLGDEAGEGAAEEAHEEQAEEERRRQGEVTQSEPVPGERDEAGGGAGEQHGAPSPMAVASGGEDELGAKRLHDAGDDENGAGGGAEQDLGEGGE